jgi:tetratricopeptide (TPR) repeat protein
MTEFFNLPPEGDYSRSDAIILDAFRTRVVTDSAAVFAVSVPPESRVSALQGKLKDYDADYAINSDNIEISSEFDSGLRRKIVRVRVVFPEAGDYYVSLHYNGSPIASYYVKADRGGANAIKSADTTVVKPSPVKRPLPERVVVKEDQNAVVVGESARTTGKTKASLQSRARETVRFVVRDKGFVGQFIERFERAVEQRDVQRAVALCDTLINLFPGEAGAYFLRGMTQASAGNHKSAVEDFSRADALEGKNALVLLQRGVSLYRLGEFQKATLDFSRAMETDYDQSVEALYWRGLARAKMNLRHKAFRDLWEAFEIGNPEAMEAIEQH